MKYERNRQGHRKKGSSINNIISEQIQVHFRINTIKLILDETAFLKKMNFSKKLHV